MQNEQREATNDQREEACRKPFGWRETLDLAKIQAGLVGVQQQQEGGKMQTGKDVVQK